MDLLAYAPDADASKQETINLTIQQVETARKVGTGSCVDPDKSKIYEEKISRSDISLTVDNLIVLDSAKNTIIPAGTNLLQDPQNYTVTIDDNKGSVSNTTISIQTKRPLKGQFRIHAARENQQGRVF